MYKAVFTLQSLGIFYFNMYGDDKTYNLLSITSPNLTNRVTTALTATCVIYSPLHMRRYFTHIFLYSLKNRLYITIIRSKFV